jgi:hypothetical protein
MAAWKVRLRQERLMAPRASCKGYLKLSLEVSFGRLLNC